VSGAVGVMAMLIWLKVVSYPNKYNSKYKLVGYRG
jgi:hypothetical protein